MAPCVLSACTHATIGSLLAGVWARTGDGGDAADGGTEGGAGGDAKKAS